MPSYIDRMEAFSSCVKSLYRFFKGYGAPLESDVVLELLW
jgi:hypothetical protein